MSTEMNREQKRAMKRMGALNEKGNPVRTQPQARPQGRDEDKVGPAQYMREVRDEMNFRRVFRLAVQGLTRRHERHFQPNN